MIRFRRPKRTVPKPEIVTTHQSDNPMFRNPTASSPALTQFRRRVIFTVVTILMLIGLGLAVYGPWFRISSVDVTGTRALNPESVKAVTTAYLDQYHRLIIPGRNLWLLSKNDIAQHLVTKISKKLSIERVNVTKHYPHRLSLQIVERTPAFVWTNGTAFATMDRQGVLIELRAESDPTLSLVRDGLALSIAPDQHVIIPEVTAKLIELQSSFDRNQLAVQEYIIPMPTCPVALLTPDQLAQQRENERANTNTAANTNDAQPVANDNANANITPEAPPCDLPALRQRSQEIHVKVQDGPLVLFDRHTNLDSAVTTLVRLLAAPENDKAVYIDIRFEERVYIK